jgi:S-formylglutathione hydrolase FrmB
MNRARAFFVFLLVPCALLAQDFVTAVEDSISSRAINERMKFVAVLPHHYRQTQERYTTIYLLHGFGGDRTDWIKRSGLVKYLEEHNFLVICPDAHNGWYTNSIDGKKKYEEYILNELVPYVERKYRTLGTRHGRVIAGLSMGGFGSLKFALKRPDKFIFAASFSGALYVPLGSRPDNKDISESLEATFGKENSDQWTQNDPLILLDAIKNVRDLPYLYISTGKDDALARIVENNRKLVEKLQQRGVLYEYHETPGGHTWIYWDKELRNFLIRLSRFDPLNP